MNIPVEVLYCPPIFVIAYVNLIVLDLEPAEAEIAVKADFKPVIQHSLNYN